MNTISLKKMEISIDNMLNSTFKDETIKDYKKFVASLDEKIRTMNSYCTSPVEQLKKQISL